MLGVKELAEGVSEALGLDGDITPGVKLITGSIIENQLSDKSKAQKAIESMRIARTFRELRDEIQWNKTLDYLAMEGIANAGGMQLVQQSNS